MTIKVTVIRTGEVLAAGDNYDFNLTLTKDGATYDLTGFTITADIYAVGVDAAILTGLTVTIVTASTGITKLTLSKANSALLSQPAENDFIGTVEHIADIKVVESGTVEVHCGPFSFPVRRKITA